MKRKSIKYIGLVLLCVAGCMFVTACGQDKDHTAKKDESVISSEAETSDAEKSTDPADYDQGSLPCCMGTGEGVVLCGSRKSGTSGN